MKQLASLRSALAILTVFAGFATAATLDRNGTWAPTVYYERTASPGTRSLVNDGSFEQGPPPASAWTETSNSPTCEWIGDFAAAWYVSSWDGYFDYWAGGYCYDDLGQSIAVTSSVTQTVPVPAEQTNLSFYYVSFRPDDDDVPTDGDRVYVAVNGFEVWDLEMIGANDTYPSWTGPIIVDLAAWAGQTVSLSFGGISVGDVTGNVRFDLIEFIPGEPTPSETSSWGTIKVRYR